MGVGCGQILGGKEGVVRGRRSESRRRKSVGWNWVSIYGI